MSNNIKTKIELFVREEIRTHLEKINYDPVRITEFIRGHLEDVKSCADDIYENMKEQDDEEEDGANNFDVPEENINDRTKYSWQYSIVQEYIDDYITFPDVQGRVVRAGGVDSDSD